MVEDVEILVNFPHKTTARYKEWNNKYVLSAPIKIEEAILNIKIIHVDIRFLIGCGLERDAIGPDAVDPSALGGPALSSSQSAPAPSDDAAAADRSRSASPPADPHDFMK